MSRELAVLEGGNIVEEIREDDEIALQYIYGFTDLPIIANIGTTKMKILKEWSIKMIEKCPLQSKDNCEKCFYSDNLDSEKNCLLRLFSFFTGRVPQPHHGQEYYDVEIDIITKSGTKFAGGVFLKRLSDNLTNSNDKRLKTQIIEVLINDAIEVIGVFAKPNAKLKAMIRNLCKKYQKRLFFIEEEDVVRMLNYRTDKDGEYNLETIAQTTNEERII